MQYRLAQYRLGGINMEWAITITAVVHRLILLQLERYRACVQTLRGVIRRVQTQLTMPSLNLVAVFQTVSTS